MSYQIYLPGKTGANPEHLRAVGLGDLIPPHDVAMECGEISRGPDGGGGQLWGWPGQQVVLSFNPEIHNAVPCVADPELKLPAGRFWWVFVKGAPPTEATLQRERMFAGFAVGLAGGLEWQVPNVLNLPEAFSFDQNGEIVKVPQKIWRPFLNEAEWALNQVAGGATNETPRDWKRELTAASRFLNANYRVNRELILHLELIDPTSVVSVLMRAVDYQRLKVLVDQLKNSTAGALTPVGSSV